MMHGSTATILDAVGGTPIVRLQRVVPPELGAELHARCEFLNPTGSMKDRVAALLLHHSNTARHPAGASTPTRARAA